MIVWRKEKLICDLNWGFCAYYDLATRSRREAQPGRRAARARGGAAAACSTTGWTVTCGSSRCWRAGESNPEGGPVPRAIERGRLGDLLAAPELGALAGVATSRWPMRREAARAAGWRCRRARRRRRTSRRPCTTPTPTVADWAAIGAVRLGDVGARERVRAVVTNRAAPRLLRIRAALALAKIGDASGVPAMNEALDHCDDVLLCRLIIITLGQLRDRRAVPALLAHLPEVQNRREMVDALGDDRRSGGVRRAGRAAAQRRATCRCASRRRSALAKLGAPSVIPALERVARSRRPRPRCRAARDARGASRTRAGADARRRPSRPSTAVRRPRRDARPSGSGRVRARPERAAVGRRAQPVQIAALPSSTSNARISGTS